MHEMETKVEKIALYRLFFEISKVTHFFENPDPKVTQHQVPLLFEFQAEKVGFQIQNEQ